MNVVFGVVHGYRVDCNFFHSVVRLLQSKPPELGDLLMVRCGPALSMGRGSLVEQFLDSTSGDALLMVDDDQWFEPATISEMFSVWEQANEQLDGGCHILSGLTWISPRGEHANELRYIPALYADTGNDDGHHVQVDPDSLPDDAFCEVAAVGAACMMVSRELLEKFRAEYGPYWFHHVILPDGDQLGEDISFCRRARDLGYHVYAHTGLFFDHSKTILMGRPTKEKVNDE